jgi:hypothetical protein
MSFSPSLILKLISPQLAAFIKSHPPTGIVNKEYGAIFHK